MKANKKLLTPLFLGAAFLMASCSTSTIVARPEWQDQSIIESIDKNTKDNQMKVIYDAVKALGDTNANVLSSMLVKIAQKHLGTFDELKAIGSKEFKDVKGTVKGFIDNSDHSYYKPIDEYKIVNGKKEKLTDEDSLRLSYEMIKSQYENIREDIAEKLFNEIKGGSYSTDNMFYERRYIQNMIKNLYYHNDNPDSITDFKGATMIFGRSIVDGEHEKWTTTLNKYLTLKDSKGNAVDAIDSVYYGTYVKEKILPDIYKVMLIESYVKNQRYSNLGRTYARKVNMITVAQGSYAKNIMKMFNEFSETYISNSTSANYNFTLLEDAMKGVPSSNDSTYVEEVKHLLEAGGFDKFTIKDTSGTEHDVNWKIRTSVNGAKASNSIVVPVYKGTKLGDLLEKYTKIYDYKGEDAETNETLYVRKERVDESAYKDLTGTGAYEIEDGLILKEREIRNTSYTKSGWFVKNGGLSDMNATYRDRLFNIQTSNLVDSVGAKEKYTSGDYVRYYDFNGIKKAFLTKDKDDSSEEEKHKSVVINDGTNVVICEVQEAVSTSKLSKDSTGSYRYLRTGTDAIDSSITMNELTQQIIKSVSSGDTYKTNANQYYLMISNIIIHDQSVYDYFKSQFPDLFK